MEDLPDNSDKLSESAGFTSIDQFRAALDHGVHMDTDAQFGSPLQVPITGLVSASTQLNFSLLISLFEFAGGEQFHTIQNIEVVAHRLAFKNLRFRLKDKLPE